MTTTYHHPHKISKQRAANLAKVMEEGYDIEDAPDSSVPGAARVEYNYARQGGGDYRERLLVSHPRLALVTQYGDKGNYRVHLAEDRRGVESLAAYLSTDADGVETIVCYFDLDELAGEEPRPYEGDRVKLTPEGLERAGIEVDYASPANDFHVVGTATDTFDGVAFERLYLSNNVAADYLSGDYDAHIDEQYVEVVERAEEDERMPVRYGLAKVVVSVVFNTVPSP